jgi:hypothetical protein
MKSKLGMNTRMLVLKQALIIENNMAGVMLNIDTDDSNLLSHKSTCLSFNTMVLLLLDMKTIDEKDKDKLRSFMEIRNKFMHSIKITSFTECSKYLESTFKKLDKYYGNEKHRNDEEKLKGLFLLLCLEIKNILKKVFETSAKKIAEDASNVFRKKFLENLLDSLSKSSDILNSIFEDFSKLHPEIDKNSLAVLNFMVINDLKKRIYDSMGFKKDAHLNTLKNTSDNL